MQIGKLRHRVTLQQISASSDGQGGKANTWGDVITLWAEVLTTESREAAAAKQITPLATHQVKIRYRPGVTAAMRFVYNAGVLAIVGPPQDPDGRRKELRIPCQSIVPEAPT